MKRKSTACKIVQAFILVLIIMLLPVTVWAQETTLTTVVPSSHTLHIELTGEASLIADGVTYTQSVDIQIQRHSRPEISLQIADGYKLKTVLWGSEDVTAAFQNGKWTAPEITVDAVLTVTLEKTNTTPQTGDTFLPELWLAIAVLSLHGMIVCLFMRRKQKL